MFSEKNFDEKRDENGLTELMRACVDDKEWEVKRLIKEGADVNAVDNRGVQIIFLYQINTKLDYIRINGMLLL